MSQFLPTGGFHWVENTEQFTEEYIKQLSDIANKGYMLEVDLEYPKELHDAHDQYPLAPEHLEIGEHLLSDDQRRMAEKFGVKIGGSKLCLTLLNKHKYICHYRNLKQYLKMGMRLKKVHSVLGFKQSPWVKKYIEKNTQIRRDVKCKAEEDLPKLMNNSFFGKTCEDVRRYRDIQLVTGKHNVKKVQKMINNPHFERVK